MTFPSRSLVPSRIKDFEGGYTIDKKFTILKGRSHLGAPRWEVHEYGAITSNLTVLAHFQTLGEAQAFCNREIDYQESRPYCEIHPRTKKKPSATIAWQPLPPEWVCPRCMAATKRGES